jgi:hypothetical protein
MKSCYGGYLKRLLKKLKFFLKPSENRGFLYGFFVDFEWRLIIQNILKQSQLLTPIPNLYNTIAILHHLLREY